MVIPWIPIVVFVAITFGVWALLSVFSKKESRASERLDVLRDPRKRGVELEKANSMGQALQKAAPALSKALGSKTELEQNKLKLRLANAGFRSQHAATIFLAIKTVSLGFGAVIGGGYGIWKSGLTIDGLQPFVLSAGLAFYLPEITLALMRRSRMQKIFLQLPDCLDLLVVCVEAGLGLDAAMRKVADEMAHSNPEITSEIQVCIKQLQLGRTRRDVLHDFGVRTGVDDVRALVAILIQADRFGSSIAQALRVQSKSMRTKRSQLAEEKAAKTAVQMIFPLVLFIFPGIFVVLVGPAAIMMIRQLLTD